MPFQQSGDIRFFTFDLLTEAGAAHAVFSRRGGISPDPWAALNFSSAVGDDPQRVSENRRRALVQVGRSFDSIYEVWQVHGDCVARADAPHCEGDPYPQADAILTDRPVVTLLMRFADCVPILLYDPHHRAAGLVHAGWQGTLKRTAVAATRAMQRQYGSSPSDLQAAIGPSIAAHHYPVGTEVITRAQEVFGMDASSLLPVENGQTCFDLWAANRLTLEQAGVRQIEISGICTACHLEDWYSHRAENGRTGRFGVFLSVPG